MLKLFSSLSGGGISTALYGVIGSLFAFLILLGLMYKNALKNNAQLQASLQIAQSNTELLEASLKKQNEAIKALEVKATKKDTSAIDRIILKDTSCEQELLGYKEIFKELGK